MADPAPPAVKRCHFCGCDASYMLALCKCKQHAVCRSCDKIPCPRDVPAMELDEFIEFMTKAQ